MSFKEKYKAVNSRFAVIQKNPSETLHSGATNFNQSQGDVKMR